MNSEALQWRTSTHSGSEGGACLEVAATPQTIHIRDSKTASAQAPTLRVTPAAWTEFLLLIVK
ncbi:DUF397 domain-containing protein [Streptomyces longwoodensis]|uniref:DUF397 domain-containing protein n=1 Tax=Streptomyces longwoodensis TaxID=68231 RepID=UPI0036FA0701